MKTIQIIFGFIVLFYITLSPVMQAYINTYANTTEALFALYKEE